MQNNKTQSLGVSLSDQKSVQKQVALTLICNRGIVFYQFENSFGRLVCFSRRNRTDRPLHSERIYWQILASTCAASGFYDTNSLSIILRGHLSGRQSKIYVAVRQSSRLSCGPLINSVDINNGALFAIYVKGSLHFASYIRVISSPFHFIAVLRAAPFCSAVVSLGRV